MVHAAANASSLLSNATPIVDQYAAAGRIWPTWTAIAYGFSAMTFQVSNYRVNVDKEIFDYDFPGK